MAGVVDEHATLPCALAVIFDAPISIVADASSLAYDEIRSGKAAFEAAEIVFNAAVVMGETTADIFYAVAIAGDDAIATAYA